MVLFYFFFFFLFSYYHKKRFIKNLNLKKFDQIFFSRSAKNKMNFIFIKKIKDFPCFFKEKTPVRGAKKKMKFSFYKENQRFSLALKIKIYF
jgi:hypothetical protein